VKIKFYQDYRLSLYGTLGLALVSDIFGRGVMTAGVLIGWLIGLLTMSQWNYEAKLTKNIKRRAPKKVYDAPKGLV